MHPFASYSAIGKRGKDIVLDVSSFAYGPDSPEDRLIELEAKRVGVGILPTKTTSIHHVEQQVAVPYRYTKEFYHPILVGRKKNSQKLLSLCEI